MSSFSEQPIYNPSNDRLPGVRGVYAVLLAPPLVQRAAHFVHLSWRGESYVIRDFLEGVGRKQGDGLALVEIWRAARVRIPCSGRLPRSIEDRDFWKEELQRLTDAHVCISAPGTGSAAPRKARRPLGLGRGLGEVLPSFFDPLSPDLLESFGGGGHESFS